MENIEDVKLKLFLPSVESVASVINDSESWDESNPSHVFNGLGELLQEIDWSSIIPSTIIPKLELRRFTKSIVDKEVRHDVMKFLYDYIKYYFYDGATKIVQDNYDSHGWSPDENYFYQEIDSFITDMQSELSTQMNQIENSDRYSGNTFHKLTNKIQSLETEIKRLEEVQTNYKNKVAELEAELDKFKNPPKKYYIPNELLDWKFEFLMEHLHKSNAVEIKFKQTSYGVRHAYYHWRDDVVHKASFGYFVDRVSHELELRTETGRLNWKLFDPAFDNFDEIFKQAKDAVSLYKYWNNPQGPLPSKHKIIDEVFKQLELEELQHPD